ncbi:Sina domain-containing protein [Heracleum sosnowskyi]|uniref:Sina domain-containing protein n=1 Tax=Heracleum sosnowskyi TaxID=360622 RepID=A0AAD8HY41_9APIA|nr:Sina domain-containing protein [Heracleum sosnowskyi]
MKDYYAIGTYDPIKEKWTPHDPNEDLAFQLGAAPVYMAFLRFMGDEADARNYSYNLELGENGRKLIWEGTPRSVRDSHRKVRDSHDGLIIQRNMALFFSGGDMKELKLRVTGRIWKEQHSTDVGVCIPNVSI